MKLSHRFSIAVHTMLCIAAYESDTKVTSGFIAESVGVNPVVIRQILGMLKKAKLVEVKAGSGGAYLRFSPAAISLRDIYIAVDLLNDTRLFNFHSNPNLQCAIGRSIHALLDGPMYNAQWALEESLRRVNLQELLGQID